MACVGECEPPVALLLFPFPPFLFFLLLPVSLVPNGNHRRRRKGGGRGERGTGESSFVIKTRVAAAGTWSVGRGGDPLGPLELCCVTGFALESFLLLRTNELSGKEEMRGQIRIFFPFPTDCVPKSDGGLGTHEEAMRSPVAGTMKEDPNLILEAGATFGFYFPCKHWGAKLHYEGVAH